MPLQTGLKTDLIISIILIIMELKTKAKSLGADDLKTSTRQGKRYMVLYNDKWIHFGSSTGSTYIDHKDVKKRDAWRARHSKITNSKGQLVYKLKESASFWAFHLLWN